MALRGRSVIPVFGLVFLFVLAASVRGDEGAPVRIGEINPLTGKLATHGGEIHEGILYAVEECNEGGGLRGRPVELVSRDDQSRPEVAIHQAEDLLYREKVVALVGGYVDSLVGPVSVLARKHEVPYVASASLQRALTRQAPNPFFFRVAHLDGIVVPLCRFVSRALSPRRVAVLFAATPGAAEMAGEVREALEKDGVEIVLFEKFRPGSPDFTPFLMKLKESGAEVLISGGFFPDHLILVRQLRDLRIPLKAYIGPWGVAYPGFVKETGLAAEHLFGMCAWAPGIHMPGTDEASRRFVRRFRERFGKEPTTTTMHGYTSARAVLEAAKGVLEEGRDLAGEALRDKLAALDILLPMERLAFDSRGDPLHYEQVVVQIQDGEIQAVFPPERAAGEVVYPMEGAATAP